MGYSLLEINHKETQRILEDASKVNWLRKRLESSIQEEMMPRYYAVNGGKNAYLISIPELVKSNILNIPFAFFMEGDFYFVNLLDLSNRVVINNSSDISTEILEKLKKEVADAFSVYGQFGRGAWSDDGATSYEVFPEFILG